MPLGSERNYNKRERRKTAGAVGAQVFADYRSRIPARFLTWTSDWYFIVAAMSGRNRKIGSLMVLALALMVASALAPPPRATAQSERILIGEWWTRWSPIDGQLFSRKGNTLGFPDRDMFFTKQGDLRSDLRICFVNREDQGPDVKPLGVWRTNGNRVSATFQLWCPDDTQPCGSIIMRGEILGSDRMRGTATAFFDEADEQRPTGYDTFPMSFRGDLVVMDAAPSPLTPVDFAAKKFDGAWVLTITIPEFAGSSNLRTLTVNVAAAPRGESLHGRSTITNEQSRTVAGVWRQSGKKVSLAYELPCAGEGDASCASLILIGKIKNNTRIKSGDVIVMWDTPNDRDPALYDTSLGSFSGERVP